MKSFVIFLMLLCCQLTVLGQRDLAQYRNHDLSEAKGNWQIIPDQSNITFQIAYYQFKLVEGEIGCVDGIINIDRYYNNSTINTTLDVSSLTTHDLERDKHLLSEDYFDVAQHPFIKFDSKTIHIAPDGNYNARGAVSIKEKSKPTCLNFVFNGLDKNGNARFNGVMYVNRIVHGVGKRSWMMDDKVKIVLEIVAEPIAIADEEEVKKEEKSKN